MRIIETLTDEPYVIASGEWGRQAIPPTPKMWTDDLATYRAGKQGQLVATDTFRGRDTFVLLAHVVDESATPLSGAQVFVDVTDAAGPVVSMQGFTDGTGSAELQWRIPRGQAAGGYTASVVDLIKSGYEYDPGQGMSSIQFFIE